MNDWRGIFDELRVQWIDSGKNASPGNVNIPCPFCRDDPSFHMAVHEEDGKYYCFRRPRQHSGSNPLHLLERFGVGYRAGIELLNRHNRGPARKREPEVPPKVIDAEARWARFPPAFENERVLDYLQGRGFLSPVSLCRRFDLRYDQGGKWSQRVLMPFYDPSVGRLVSWTGRAVRPDLEPKYYNQEVNDSGLVYIPGPIRATTLLVEGPMDALKIAASTERVGVIALAGKASNAGRILRIARIIEPYVERLLLSLDADAPLGDTLSIRKQLAGAAPMVYIRRLAIPANFKDAGQMPQDFVSEWIDTILKASA